MNEIVHFSDCIVLLFAGDTVVFRGYNQMEHLEVPEKSLAKLVRLCVQEVREINGVASDEALYNGQALPRPFCDQSGSVWR